MNYQGKVLVALGVGLYAIPAVAVCILRAWRGWSVPWDMLAVGLGVAGLCILIARWNPK